MPRITLGILLALIGSKAAGIDLLDSFPENIHSNEKYVFYSHGLIVEGTNPQPEHPDFGIYDFPAIKQELFKEGDFNLIAEHRPKNADPKEYAGKLVLNVKALIQAGVEPNNITLIGFSRGAQITASASYELSESGINTVLIGICSNGDYKTEEPIIMGGHILSIYETSDVVGSCNKLLERSNIARSMSEIAISTGLSHGAFYTPLPEWLEPLKVWLMSNNGR